MARLLLSRLFRLIVTVWLVSTVVFLILRVIPGDPAATIAGIEAGEGEIEAIQERLGTDRSLPRQYGSWLLDVARLDFGRSFYTDRSVRSLIVERLPVTLGLAFGGFLVALAIAVPLGVASAVRPWTPLDYFGMTVSQVGMALPSFWLGILLLLVFSLWLRLVPLFGVGTAAHFMLPSLALGIARGAFLLRIVRGSVLEEIKKDYVVGARAKGLTEGRVRYVHVLRNALFPVLTVAGIQFGYLIGGAIVIEEVFSLPGLGRLFLSAIHNRDFPLVQGGVVFVAMVFSLLSALVDTLYVVLNPRVRRGQAP
jgi:peptide/nickel transport system permease protein